MTIETARKICRCLSTRELTEKDLAIHIEAIVIFILETTLSKACEDDFFYAAKEYFRD